MSDFASGTLVRALMAEFRRQGLFTGAHSSDRNALVPLPTKRVLLQMVAAVHGTRPLLVAGHDAVFRNEDPVLSALVSAQCAVDLFARWGRLERFLHSRHRVVVTAHSDAEIEAHHVDIDGHSPSAAENAVILGVLSGLLSRSGAENVSAWDEHDGPFALALDRPCSDRTAGPTGARWRFAWSGWRKSALPILPSVSGLAQQARAQITHDPSRAWKLADVAAACATSPRSLQRSLQGEGGFAAVLGGVRSRCAAELLQTADLALAEIGFAAGYADQSHFTREFKRRTALTPAAYQRTFCAPAQRAA